MAKKNEIRHFLKSDTASPLSGYIMTGIQTGQPVYKLAFDFNRLFHWNLQLQPDIEVIRNNQQIYFENYATPENPAGNKIRLINNKIRMALPHPDSLFDTHEIFYLFTKAKFADYILMLPVEDNLNVDEFQRIFNVAYPVKFVNVNIEDCILDLPVFPL